MTSSYRNPVLPGFYPDPSCIRVGDTFYMANSSFQFFPGIPIHKSKDLINWTQIGNALCRPEQLSLTTATTKINNASKNEIYTAGIYAPTIRHHNGRSYIICTYLTGETDMPNDEDFAPQNFIITSDNLEDPSSFSNPIYFDFFGIDPSLLFDDDGRVYVQGSWIHGYHLHPATVIRQVEIDIETGALLSETRDIWAGYSMKVPEGPHLYKKDGWYYLLVAEGGTHRRHMITMSRSRDVWGPYESCDKNPILTTAGPEAIVQCVGHGDLFEDTMGKWWVVMLARREYVGQTSYPLGRETFMAPVEWPEGEFPTCSPVEILQKTDRKVAVKEETQQESNVVLASTGTIYLRTPDLGDYAQDGNDLVLTPREAALGALDGTLTFVGQRQTALNSITSVCLPLDELSGKKVYGLTVYKDPFRYVAMQYDAQQGMLGVKLQTAGKGPSTLCSVVVQDASLLRLSIRSSKEKYVFSMLQTDANGKAMDEEILTEIECSVLSGDDFTGTVYAIFATGTGEPVRFRDFRVQALAED